jgi:hypothetical protein
MQAFWFGKVKRHILLVLEIFFFGSGTISSLVDVVRIYRSQSKGRYLSLAE